MHDDGDIKPKFYFKNRELSRRKEWHEIDAPAIPIDNAIVEQGDVFVGVDFGHSYCYVTRLLEIAQETPDFSFPNYQYRTQIKGKLSELNSLVEKYQRDRILTEDAVLRQARRQTLNAVFHSNKIEGVTLTLGETEEAINRGHLKEETPGQASAVNLQEAYLWTLDNARAYQAQPEVFVRSINQMLLKGIHNKAGQYRDGQVKISGLAWSPPPPTSVGPLMSELAKELVDGPRNRSVLEYAASVHTKLVTIHPFFDGNGRTARLLLNAILVGFGWPAIIVRFDDRSRYLDALEKSNKGNIGELILLFVDLCRAELDDVYLEHQQLEAKAISDVRKDTNQGDSTNARQQVQEKTREIDLDSYSDPLAEVLRLKRDTERSMLSDVYEEWSGKWLNFLTNIKDFAKDVAQAPQYSGGGIEVKVNDFGIITFESFCDMYNGHQFKQSWFFSLEIVSRKEKEIYMFHFDKDSEVKTALKLQTQLPISLFISRYVSNEYRRLSTEPVSLRCFRLVDGNVTAFLQAGAMSEQDVTKVINRFVAEVVLDYLIPEGLG